MKPKPAPDLEALSSDQAKKIETQTEANPKATPTEIGIAVDNELAQLSRTIVENIVQTKPNQSCITSMQPSNGQKR